MFNLARAVYNPKIEKFWQQTCSQPYTIYSAISQAVFSAQKIIILITENVKTTTTFGDEGIYPFLHVLCNVQYSNLFKCKFQYFVSILLMYKSHFALTPLKIPKKCKSDEKYPDIWGATYFKI
jgi:hypothetical protein